MISRRRVVQAAGIGFASSIAGVRAQTGSSDKVVHWVLGFSAGGGTDYLARVLAPRVAAKLGMNVIVENKPGANGNLAAECVARAPADGLTYLYNTSSLVTSPALYAKLNFDPLRDLVPVAPIANVPLLLVAHPSLAPDTIAEFIAYGKANPDKLTHASAGNGNVTHLSNLLFQQTVGISATHIPYKGGGPALNDLLGGHVNFYMDTSNKSAPYVQKKLLKAYATTGMKRLVSLPDVPTVAETASPGFDTGSWTGLVAPARTPPDMVARMNAAVRAVQQDPAAIPLFAQQEAQIRVGSPEQYRAFLRAEMERWSSLIGKNNVRVE